MPTFITTSITWGDDFETNAATASEAVRFLVVDSRREATTWMGEWRTDGAIASEVQP